VSFVDAEERYRFVNKAYEEWFGVSSDALRGRFVRDVIGDLDVYGRVYLAYASTGYAVGELT